MNSNQSAKEDEMLRKIDTLQKIITNVYLPWMEDKPETRLHLEKFVKQISNTKQQAYGNVTIEIPEIPNISKVEMSKDAELLNLIQKTVVSLRFILYILMVCLLCFYRNNGRKLLRQQLK